ncbi:MAG: hypothetical protein RIS94_2000 [Pseudomonadota bacterium]|jgi:PAS domain S-box-containing protein
MTAGARPARQYDGLLAVLLGLVGFALNFGELQLGWGIHFIFGNALIYAFLRVLRPAHVTLAIAIASIRSILLWHHPWAWLIWTLEAWLVATIGARVPPVRVDTLFWLVLGCPLLIASYGWIMDLDRLSVVLVIAKQAANGVLNVTLGEFLYAGFLARGPAFALVRLPRMPADAVLLTLLLLIVLAPATVYLAVDAPTGEVHAREAADKGLADDIGAAAVTLEGWQKSRSAVLRAYAAGGIPGDSTELTEDFSRILTLDAKGRVIADTWPAGGPSAELRYAASRSPRNLRDAGDGLIRLVSASAGTPRLALVVSSLRKPGRERMIAELRPWALSRAVRRVTRGGPSAMVLVDANAHVLPLVGDSAGVLPLLKAWQAGPITRLPGGSALISPRTYGRSLMADIESAIMVHVDAAAPMPGWRLIAAAPFAPEVMKEREQQAYLFLMLNAFVFAVVVAGSVLSAKLKRSLRALAQGAADLALAGVQRGRIDSLVVRELSDISISLATVGSQVARERGALLRYQSRLTSIARSAPIVVYALMGAKPDESRVVYLSAGCTSMLGYAVAELEETERWTGLIHPDDRAGYRACLASLEPGQSANLEYRIRHAMGHYLWVYDSIALEEADDQGRCELIGLLLDISERKRTTAQLAEADKMAGLGRMVTGIAHELHQPLNFIKMAAVNMQERLKRGQPDPQLLRGKLESILAHVSRSSAIILQMRVFGRAGPEDAELIDIADVIDIAASAAELHAETAGTMIRMDCEQGLVVKAVPILLEQVLLHLITNAVDAIAVRARRKAEPTGRISIVGRASAEDVVITIDDNGTGIDPDVLSVIFEPFYTTKAPREGTGLSLSISYGIIRDLGGTILAENTPEGARFTVRLPRQA